MSKGIIPAKSIGQNASYQVLQQPKDMGNNYDKMFERAEKEVLEIITNDDKWKLFVRQMGQHKINLRRDAREIARTSKPYRDFLKTAYIRYSATQICDACDYNPNHRRGQRKFSARNRFDCEWMKTQGDVFAEQTAKEEGHGGALYKFDDSEWKARYQELAKIVLEEHKDRTKAPPWLDTKRNLCPHYYIDLTRP